MTIKHPFYSIAVLRVVHEVGGRMTFDQYDDATATSRVVDGKTIRGPCLGVVPSDWMICGWGLPSHLHSRNMWRLAAMDAVKKKLLRASENNETYTLTKLGKAALSAFNERSP
jgi:hypothetical protein